MSIFNSIVQNNDMIYSGKSYCPQNLLIWTPISDEKHLAKSTYEALFVVWIHQMHFEKNLDQDGGGN
jgi:hypothetical protein